MSKRASHRRLTHSAWPSMGAEEDKRRVMDELECVAAMYDDGDSSCSVGASAGDSFSVAVHTRLEGRGGAVVAFNLPPGYPSAAPCRASLRCDAVSNAERDRLADTLRAAAADCAGEEAVLRCIQALQGYCEENPPRAAAGGAEGSTAAASAPDPAPAPAVIAVRMLWFHHIKSLTKRRFIVDAARSHGLGGFSKPGYPGVVVIEGEEGQCDSVVKSIRGLRWCVQAEESGPSLSRGARGCRKAMALRAELSQPVPPSSDLDAARRFRGPFVVCARLPPRDLPDLPLMVAAPVAQELGEDEMGEAAARCRAAGYENEFCHAVLKVRPKAV